MLINNKNIADYGIEILDKKVNTSSFSTTKNWSNQALTPILINKKFTYGSMELTLLISCKLEKDIKTTKSNFIMNISESIIKDDDFYYKVTLNSVADGEEVFKNKLNGMYCEKFSINLIIDEKYKEEIIKDITLSNNKFIINVEGNTETPCILEIVPSQAMVDLVIQGVTENPIKVNDISINSSLVINGEDEIITLNGANKFSDSDMWAFPVLKPGENEITFSKNYFNGKIKYKPRFI